MDNLVLQSLTKWPAVPNCFGWLALDRRGRWRIRSEYTQKYNLPGEVIQNSNLNNFITRNYSRDQIGRYFFQNGPQRVFITLDAAPWIVRITPSNEVLQLVTQCQNEFHPQEALSDESGNIFISGITMQSILKDEGIPTFIQLNQPSIALLHDHDLGLFSDLAKLDNHSCSLESSWNWLGRILPIHPIHSLEIPSKFGFNKNPVE